LRKEEKRNPLVSFPRLRGRWDGKKTEKGRSFKKKTEKRKRKNKIYMRGGVGGKKLLIQTRDPPAKGTKK